MSLSVLYVFLISTPSMSMCFNSTLSNLESILYTVLEEHSLYSILHCRIARYSRTLIIDVIDGFYKKLGKNEF